MWKTDLFSYDWISYVCEEIYGFRLNPLHVKVLYFPLLLGLNQLQ